MKFQKISTILIWTSDYEKLSTWYEHIFQLKLIETIRHPDDTGNLYEFPEGGSWIWIGKHSKIAGKNKDPHRIMFNINVDSVTEVYDYLIKNNVECIAKPFKAPTFSKFFATFVDPDGNTFQIIGLK